MRTSFKPIVEQGRCRDGDFGTDTGEPFGAFFLKFNGEDLKVIAGNGDGHKHLGLLGEPWDHVSVSCKNRIPTWKEMCWVKDLFFDDEEMVVQFHPPKSKYINVNPLVLHLWRPHETNIPLPPEICV